MWKRRVLAVLVMIACGTQAFGQSNTTGAISGIVKDAASGAPLPGVTVVVTSPSLQGSQAEITDGSGHYKIDNLPPGMYLVTFYYSELEVRRPEISVNLNRVTTVNQKIDLTEDKGEVVVVEDSAPAIDVTRTNQGTRLDSDYLRHVPVPGRTFASSLGAAPGSQGDSRGVGFSGSTSLENNYVIDGVNTTSLTFGSIGTPLLNDFIEEIEIITGGYQAEYGRATGAVVNVVTKQGSNEFHGSVFSTIIPYEKEPTPVRQQTSAIEGIIDLDWLADFGVELGGPIVKDKVWFYVGFAPRLLQTNVGRLVKRRTDCRGIAPDGSLTDCDPGMYGDGLADVDPDTGFLIFEEVDRNDFKINQQSYQFVTKVNLALAPEHQGAVSLLGTPTTGNGIFGVFGTDNATRADFTSLNTDFALRWTSKFNNNKTQLEALVGWHRDKYDQDALDDATNDVPGTRVYFSNLSRFGEYGGESTDVMNGCRDSGDASVDPYPNIDNCPLTQYWLDSPGFIIDNLEDRKSGAVKLSHRVTAAGHHDLKTGIDIEDNTIEDLRKLNGGHLWYLVTDRRQVWDIMYTSAIDPAANDDICGFPEEEDPITGEREPRACDYLDSSFVRGNTLNWATFVQDSWSIVPNLHLNIGVRYEEQRLRYAERIRNTIDPFTDEPLGTNALVLRNMWAPRLGIVYDWTKEGRSKVYASAGRFYESIPMGLNDFALSGDSLYAAMWDYDACQSGDAESPDSTGQAPSPRNCPTTQSEPDQVVDDFYAGGATLITPGTRPMYLDEAILGVEYEVIEDLTLGLSVKRRVLGNVLEDVSIDAAETYIVGNPGTFDEDEEAKLERQIEALPEDDPERVRLETRLEQFRALRGFDKPRRNYTAVELVAKRRLSRTFFAQAAYTFQRTRGNYPGLVDDDTGAALPNLSGQYDLIELLANRDGPLPQERTHVLMIDGYKIWDFADASQFVLGARFRAFSGTPRNALGGHYLYGRGASYLLPRGSMGRTDAVATGDIHVSYSRQLAYGYDLAAFIDVLHVENAIFEEPAARRDDEYTTLDYANPIVGGSYEDLVYLKSNTTTGVERPDPVRRNVNFGNVSARYTPMSVRFGIRLSF